MRTNARWLGNFRQILTDEDLLDFSQFNQLGFFDEVPLDSRTSQLAFLSGLREGKGGYGDRGTKTRGPSQSSLPEEPERLRIDRVLRQFGLDYLDSLLQVLRPRGTFLAALTVARPARNAPILPSIFLCHGGVDDRLIGRIFLDEPKAVLSVTLSEILQGSDELARYEILQETNTIPREARVFIGLVSPCNLLMVPISSLRANVAAKA